MPSQKSDIDELVPSEDLQNVTLLTALYVTELAYDNYLSGANGTTISNGLFNWNSPDLSSDENTLVKGNGWKQVGYLGSEENPSAHYQG